VPKLVWDDWNRDADRMIGQDTSAGRTVMRGFYAKGLALTGAAYRAGVRVVLGTDAGDSYVFPGSAVHDELAELVTAGLTPAQALRAATLDAAEFLGASADHGSVTVGKRADLVLLHANPLEDITNTRQLATVIFGGVVSDRPRLDSLLRGVEEVVKRPLNP
jgi:imidazolonepropionase-like amidohydrolase